MGDSYVRKLTPKNLKKWQADFPFVDKHPELENQVYCTLCKQTLTPKRDVIDHHAATKTHRIMSESQMAETGSHSASDEESEIAHLPTSHIQTSVGIGVKSNITISQPPKIINIGSGGVANEATAIFATVGGPNEFIIGDYEIKGAEIQEEASYTAILPEGTMLAEISVQDEEGNMSQSFARISANAQFPFFVEQEIQKRFFTMEGYDALWRCKGGVFKMHKFVVSLFSPVLKDLLYSFSEDEECIIHTPDLSSLVVKSFLCLCYTGRVILPTEDITTEVIKAFNEFGGHGQFTVEQQKVAKIKDQDLVRRLQGGTAGGGAGKRKLAIKPKRRRRNVKMKKALEAVGEGLDPDQIAQLMDEDIGFSDLPENEHLNETEDYYDDSILQDDMDGGWKPTKHDEVDTVSSDEDDERMPDKKIKVEMDDSQDFVYVSDDLSHLMVPTLDQSQEQEEDSLDRFLAVQDEEDKENMVSNTNNTAASTTTAVAASTLATANNKDAMDPLYVGEKKKKKPIERHRDTANRFFLIGSSNNVPKGQLSAQLPADLLDKVPDQPLDSLNVCHLCYQVFPFNDAFNLHMDEKHYSKRPRNGRFYLGDNKYHCPTCAKDICVVHVVWFLKHLKYCGVDDEKASQVLSPGDIDEPVPVISKHEPKDPYMEDRVTGKVTDKRFKSLCELLFGKLNDSVWGCRTCYEVFPNKPDLVEHYTVAHGGRMEYGACYDEESKLYTCPYCNLVLKKTHLIHFIRHVKQCLVDPTLALMRNHEEEGVEEDETPNTIDPWGVVNRPLRVSNLRSEWICEALFGRFIPILFPCHICYSVFQDEKEIKQHFSEKHPNMENCVENGSLYNKETDSYTCPVCRKDVCKNQKSSIYFTYHWKKCAGETRPVTRTCDKCNKSFNKYNTYTNHQLYFCASTNNGFICHICSTVIKTKRELDTHVKYVHSSIRQFQCEHCQKRFKRKGDLVVHQQTHTATPGFFCDKCGKSFFKKRNLKSHLSTHDTSDASKRHECHECGRRFLRLQALKNHLTTHSNERLYACEVCGARVKTPGTLMTHRRKVHKLTTAPPPETKLAPAGSALISAGGAANTITVHHGGVVQQLQVASSGTAVVTTPTAVVVGGSGAANGAAAAALGGTVTVQTAQAIPLTQQHGDGATTTHHVVHMDAAELQHAGTTADGATILLINQSIKTEKLPNEEDNMPHLM